MTQLAKGVVKKLFTQGVLPLYKDKGVSKQDLANWVNSLFTFVFVKVHFKLLSQTLSNVCLILDQVDTLF